MILLREIGDDFYLERALANETLPGVYLSPQREELLESYANTYLGEVELKSSP